ncbi:MAG: class I mannose-6-phosphate isomerase [Odoribacteraceae bacterium]|jgi:mannose-6-phosphate isomerase|nr:class I mannose-6-phosphate isomerase [Odoribacteraceae bacterium]
MLYPFKFHPILKPTIWGGERLRAKSEQTAGDIAGSAPIGESWEISAVEEHVSVVSNGPLAGNDLQELVEIYMGDLVGDAVYERFGIEFPLLIKYIDARDDLSIQVHPDDETARRRHNANGKTEMWFLVDADPEASLVLGFDRPTDKAEFLREVDAGRLMNLLHVEPARAGGCFFIPAGLVHAIRSGCFIAEIQQTSDITYRVYDYDRKDAAGHERELHVDLAADVIDYRYSPRRAVNYAPRVNQSTRLVSCPYFTTSLLEIDREIARDYISIDSFVIYMCLEGRFTIVAGGCDPVTVSRGETVLVPAVLKNLTLYPDEVSRLLEIFIE